MTKKPVLKKTFQWNPFADQPHNVASRPERLRHHFRYAGGYIPLIFSNLRKALPVLWRYRKLKKTLYRKPVPLGDPFALAVSPADEMNAELLRCLRELNIKACLVRIPSWEKERLDKYIDFCDQLKEQGVEITLALLQQRDDILDPDQWILFLKEVFSHFSGRCRFFEIGHAWNRTKWGIWDYHEYLSLAHAAFSYAKDYAVQLIGPAVIDFEFHLYPPLLKLLPFDIITSLLYVDRVGAPENTQFGWDTAKKTALLKAVVDKCSSGPKRLWITEMNWPLQGTGKYSPVSGKPNVTEEQQADYLVRYFILALAGGFVEKIFWWQLVAPGYGLIDNREQEWRKRPSYFAYQTMIELLTNSIFQGRFSFTKAEIFMFCRRQDVFAVAWTKGEEIEYTFPGQIKKIQDRSGRELPTAGNTVVLDHSPKYIFYEHK